MTVNNWDSNRKRRKRVPLYLTDGERALLDQKASQYGYSNLNDYVRDASIYENLYIENIEGKNEIRSQVNQLIDEILKYADYQKRILYRKELSKEDVKIFHKQNEDLKRGIDALIKTVNDKLKTDVSFMEKYPNNQQTRLDLIYSDKKED